MFKHFQKLGGALFTPVLLFPLAGLIVAFTIVLRNPNIVGSLANPNGIFYKIIMVIEEGGWTVFKQSPLIFAVGLPIGLAKKAHPRACLAVLVSFLTFNYFISAILRFWDYKFGIDFSQSVGGISGLTMIAGIKTLDTNILGSIIVAVITIWIHNKFFDKKLPDFLGTFQGTVLVVAISFVIMLPLAYLTCLIWPKIQFGINSLQKIMISSGAFGVWLYTFLERILLPTGLHHFIYGPFMFGPALVDSGIHVYWAEHLLEFSNTTTPLKELFPQGGFSINGNSKVFGSIGIALAIYKTALPKNKKIVSGLLIPATLTSILVGITEPLDFTFLFTAPLLYVIHSVLAATMTMFMYIFGVVGLMGAGLIQFITINWLPLFKNHYTMVFTQIFIGFLFTIIYYFIFKYLILKLNIKTPGREENKNIKLYSKKDLENKTTKNTNLDSLTLQAIKFLEALGNKENIESVNNCATRLRVVVKDVTIVKNDDVFKEYGAHGVVRNGNSLQLIIGLSVPQLKEKFENLI